MGKDLQFIESKGDVVQNLEAIELNLLQFSNEKTIAFKNAFYDQILDLIEEARNASSWHELADIISKAKILEIDIASFLSRHGQASMSLPWPKIPTK